MDPANRCRWPRCPRVQHLRHWSDAVVEWMTHRSALAMDRFRVRMWPDRPRHHRGDRTAEHPHAPPPPGMAPSDSSTRRWTTPANRLNPADTIGIAVVRWLHRWNCASPRSDWCAAIRSATTKIRLPIVAVPSVCAILACTDDDVGTVPEILSPVPYGWLSTPIWSCGATVSWSCCMWPATSCQWCTAIWRLDRRSAAPGTHRPMRMHGASCQEWSQTAVRYRFRRSRPMLVRQYDPDIVAALWMIYDRHCRVWRKTGKDKWILVNIIETNA